MARLPQMLIGIGDSTTLGSLATRTWGDQLRAQLGYGFTFANYGVLGQTASGGNTIWTTNVRTALATTKFSASPTRRLFLFLGINDDLASTPAATTYATLKGIIDAAVADNASVPGTWKHIYFMTPAPCKDYSGWTSGKQAIISALNASILGYVGAKVTPVDVYTLLGDSADPDKLSTTATGSNTANGVTVPRADYKTASGGGSTDGLHFNNAACAAIATVLKTLMAAET